MQAIKVKNFILSIAGVGLLGIGLLGSNEASALSVDTSSTLPGIPTAGSPSFNFNDSGGDYSETIDSWFTNIVYIANNGAAGYTLYAYQEGNFTYWAGDTTSYSGTNGVFNLQAEYDASGVFQNGTATINGIIPSLINSDSLIMSANLTSFNFQNNLVGFATDITYCNPLIAIGDAVCTFTESIYFNTTKNLPDIGSLTTDFQTSMASKTTIPIPAAAWLMLSGLGLLGAFTRRRRGKAMAQPE
jgi:hypothetical protein